MEITFVPGIDLSVRRLAEIRAALHRIPPSGVQGGWSVTPDHIEVTGLIDGGFSGAVVAQLILHSGTQTLRRIAKFGLASEMRQELHNYTSTVQSHLNVVCAPIDASSLIDGGPSDQLEALVYDHVAQFAGSPDIEALTLEELVRDGDTDRAVRVIERLFVGMASPFHGRTKPRNHKSLRAWNATLGPDIVVRAGDVDVEQTWAEEIFQTSLGADGVRVGTPIRISGIEWEPGASLGRLEDITVRVEGGDRAADVRGHIVRTRFAWHSERLAKAFHTFERHGEAVVADGVRCADPSAGLRMALCDTRFGRVLTVVHGDLNPRNVMVVPGSDHVILIDYARTASEQPVLVDPAWLEVNLLRNVHSGLGFADLVKLQRVLGLAGRLLSQGCPADEVGTACAGLIADRSAGTAFLVLFAIRAQALKSYHHPDEWWAAYAAILLLCAHHTVRWENQHQTDARLRVAAAVASVAGEWLSDTGPFTYWDDVGPAIRAVTSVLDAATTEGAVEFVAALAAVDPAIEVDELRERVLRATRRDDVSREVIGFADAAVGLVALIGETGGEVGAVDQLVADRMECALFAPAGTGKTTAMRALAYRMALNVVRDRSRTSLDGPMRMVARVDARALADLGDNALPPRALLVLGAVHLVVDDASILPPAARERIGRWLRELRERYPRTPVVVLERDSGVTASVTGFPEVRIRPLTAQQIYDHVESLVVLRRIDAAHGRLLLRALRGTWPESHGVLRIPAGLSLFVRTGEVARTSAELLTSEMSEERQHELVSLAPGALDGTDDIHAFESPTQLDYFAALALDRMPDEDVRRSARQFRWREACLLAVDLPGTGDRVTEALVAEAIDTDPLFAGRLLARVRHPPAHLVTRFLAAQRKVLDEEWRTISEVNRAVEALVALGTPAAYRMLAESESFEGLAAIRKGIQPGPDRAQMDEAFRHVAARALDPAAPDVGKVAALKAVTVSGISGLELLIGELVESPSWEVASAAWTALLRRGVEVPPRHHAAYLRHLRDRLAAVETELPRTAVVSRKGFLQDERMNLLVHLADPETLLERRFRYEIADDVADLLHGLSAFSGDATQDGLRDLANLPVRTANLVAHQALPDQADALVAAASAQAGEHLLLIAAAALPHAGAAALRHVTQVVHELAPIVEADRFEGCAALVNAIAVVDAVEGARIAETCATTLAARMVPGRLTWPLSTAIARARAGSTELGALAADTFHRDGRRPGPGRAGRAVLTGHDATPQWAVAVAAAGLTEALPRVRQVLAECADHDAVQVSSPRYGVLELAPAAEVLSSIGYLARLAHDEGAQPAEVMDVARLVHDPGLDAKHPSLREGRLIAAAYLGDWVPLLEALEDNERLHAAARHALTLWAPGPATSPTLQTPAAIAQWLVDRLAARDDQHRCAREVLVELLDIMEQRSGERTRTSPISSGETP